MVRQVLLIIVAFVVFHVELAAQVVSWHLDRSENYRQTSADIAPLHPESWSIEIFIETTFASDAAIVDITVAGNTLALQQKGPIWRLLRTYDSSAELELDFPTGSTPQVSLSGGTLGLVEQSISLSDPIFPGAPFLTGADWGDCQRMDPNEDFLLHFNDPVALDAVLQVWDQPFREGQLLADLAVGGGLATVILPEFTLSGGNLVYGSLSFSDAATQTTDPGLPSFTVKSSSQTRFKIHPEVGLELAISEASAAGLTGCAAMPNAIPFGDGVSNFMKYACNMPLAQYGLGILPSVMGTAGVPRIEGALFIGPTALRSTFLRRKGAGISYEMESSTSLQSGSFAFAAGVEQIEPIDVRRERVEVTDSGPPDGAFFARVRMEPSAGDLIVAPERLEDGCDVGNPLDRSVVFLGDSLLGNQIYEIGRRIPDYAPLIGQGGWRYPLVGGTNAFDRSIWPTKYSTSYTHKLLGSGQSVFIARDTVGVTLCNEVTVYYVAEAGAGMFDLQIGPPGGPFQTVATIDADNGGAMEGGVARVALPTFRQIAINCAHLSGGDIKILAGNFRTRGASGVQAFYMVDGGSDVNHWSGWNPDIALPILNDLAPDLVYFQVADSATDPDKLPGHLDTLFDLTQDAFAATERKPNWLVLPRNPWLGTNSDATQATQAAWLRAWAVDRGQMFIDVQPIYGTGELADHEGLVRPNGDVHPSDLGHSRETNYVLSRLLFLK